jgi:sugar lactone lactonase YvrE
MACDASGNIYAMAGNQIKRVSPAGVISTLADVGQIVNNPCFDAAGNLYVSSVFTGEQILRVSPAGVVTTIVTPFQSFIQIGIDANFVFGWFIQASPAWNHMTIDKRTGNLYVGYDEQIFRATPDGKTLTPVYGGEHSGFPAMSIGQEFLSGGTPLHAGSVFADPGFVINDMLCSPTTGKIYIANSGFVTGVGADDVHHRFNIDIWDPASPSTLGFTLGSAANFLLANDEGPDVDGATASATIGQPYSPALSPDGKTLYFVTVVAGRNLIIVKKTNAL